MKQFKAIRKGFQYIVPQELLKIFTWREIEYKIVGKKEIDVEHLKSITRYQSATETTEEIVRFWRVLSEFSDEEKSLYLKFVWGRSRLPLKDDKNTQRHTVYL